MKMGSVAKLKFNKWAISKSDKISVKLTINQVPEMEFSGKQFPKHVIIKQH